jgi:hypothetical protein
MLGIRISVKSVHFCRFGSERAKTMRIHADQPDPKHRFLPTSVFKEHEFVRVSARQMFVPPIASTAVQCESEPQGCWTRLKLDPHFFR